MLSGCQLGDNKRGVWMCHLPGLIISEAGNRIRSLGACVPQMGSEVLDVGLLIGHAVSESRAGASKEMHRMYV